MTVGLPSQKELGPFREIRSTQTRKLSVRLHLPETNSLPSQVATSGAGLNVKYSFVFSENRDGMRPKIHCNPFSRPRLHSAGQGIGWFRCAQFYLPLCSHCSFRRARQPVKLELPLAIVIPEVRAGLECRAGLKSLHIAPSPSVHAFACGISPMAGRWSLRSSIAGHSLEDASSIFRQAPRARSALPT